MTENILRGSPDAEPPRAGIRDVAWIAGAWYGEALGGQAEETWSAPSAGTMMGMYRLVKEERVIFYELLTIVEEAGSLILRLKHFDPELGGWEEKDQALQFPLVKIGSDEVYFDGLTFRRAGETLHVFVAQHAKDGTTGELAFRYTRLVTA